MVHLQCIVNREENTKSTEDLGAVLGQALANKKGFKTTFLPGAHVCVVKFLRMWSHYAILWDTVPSVPSKDKEA